jgi:hypothetical protein
LWDAQREFPVAVTANGAQDARCMTGGNDDVFSYEVNQSDPHGWVVWWNWLLANVLQVILWGA